MTPELALRLDKVKRSFLQLVDQERYVEAKTLLLSANEEFPENSGILMDLATTCGMLDEYAAGAAYAAEAAAIRPNDENASLRLFELSWAAGDFSAAVGEAARYLKDHSPGDYEERLRDFVQDLVDLEFDVEPALNSLLRVIGSNPECANVTKLLRDRIDA